jgi:hypothetical protein
VPGGSASGAWRAGRAVPPRRPAARPPRAGLLVARLVFDVGAPVGLYYALRGLGLSSLVALSAGAAASGLSAGWTLARRRRADGVALVVLATMLASIAVSAVAHDPRFLLAREGVITGLWGVWFVGSVWTRRPAAFAFTRPLLEGRRAFAAGNWDALWAAEPAFRRIWRVSSALWAAGLLADGVARVVMSYTLPVAVVPALGGALWPATFILLQLVTNVYYHAAGLYRILGARWLKQRAVQ